MAGKPPFVAAGISHTGAPIAVERDLRHANGYATSCNCASIEAVHVIDIHMQIHRHGFRRVSNFYHRIADLHRGVHDFTVGSLERFTDFYCVKHPFQKFDDLRCAVDNEIRIDRVKAFGRF